MKKLVVEFIGTFIIVTTVGNALAISLGWAPCIVAVAWMIVIHAANRHGDAHFNPAVSVALWRRGKLNVTGLAARVCAQLAGATLAAFFVRLINGHGIARALEIQMGMKMNPSYKPPGLISLFLIEAAWTALVAWVYQRVPSTRKLAGRPFNGVALGLTYYAGFLIQGSLIYGVFNPAVHLGLVFMKFKEESSIFLYWGAQILGGILAGGGFKGPARRS